MTFDEIVKTLGLPGLLILVWYLLELQKAKRAEKADEAKSKLEEQRLKIEDQKIAAMTAGFQALIAKLDGHQHDEFEHHAQTREAIVAMHVAMANQFDFTPPPQEPPKPPPKKFPTPPQGTTYSYGRPGTKGGDR